MPPPAPIHQGIFRAFGYFQEIEIYNLSFATGLHFRHASEGIWHLRVTCLGLCMCSGVASLGALDCWPSKPKVDAISLVSYPTSRRFLWLLIGGRREPKPALRGPPRTFARVDTDPANMGWKMSKEVRPPRGTGGLPCFYQLAPARTATFGSLPIGGSNPQH